VEVDVGNGSEDKSLAASLSGSALKWRRETFHSP
jgi:hypothetical protein